MKQWAAVLLTGCLLFMLAGCAQQQAEETSREEQKTTEFAIGEKAPILVIDENETEKLVGYLTIDSVRLTDERLSDEADSPERVAVIRYTYENAAIDTGMMISAVQLRVSDELGNTLEGYPMVSTDALPAIADLDKNTTCTAEQSYVLGEGNEVIIEYHHILTVKTPLLRFKASIA